jgi:hypothetical protein
LASHGVFEIEMGLVVEHSNMYRNKNSSVASGAANQENNLQFGHKLLRMRGGAPTFNEHEFEAKMIKGINV